MRLGAAWVLPPAILEWLRGPAAHGRATPPVTRLLCLPLKPHPEETQTSRSQEVVTWEQDEPRECRRNIRPRASPLLPATTPPSPAASVPACRLSPIRPAPVVDRNWRTPGSRCHPA